AESIRAYQQSFWRCLPLGLPLAVADQLSVHHTAALQAFVYWVLTPAFVAAYLWGCRLVLAARPTRTAVVVALLISLPFPALRAFYIIPGLAWFALIGLAVPAAMVDQSARLRSRNARVHPPLDTEPAGRADAQVEP